jgi:hypothetical protein
MRSLVESLGVQIEPMNNRTWKIQASQVRPADLILICAGEYGLQSCSPDQWSRGRRTCFAAAWR